MAEEADEATRALIAAMLAQDAEDHREAALHLGLEVRPERDPRGGRGGRVRPSAAVGTGLARGPGTGGPALRPGSPRGGRRCGFLPPPDSSRGRTGLHAAAARRRSVRRRRTRR